MASQIAFNKIRIGSETLLPAEFVSGSGNLTVSGTDKTINTADGCIHNFRIARTKSVSCRLYGDHRSLASSPGDPTEIQVSYNSTVIATFDGLVQTEYQTDPETTSIQINGTPDELSDPV